MTLLATSRIQNPTTKTATALGRVPPRSPRIQPRSAECPMMRTARTMDKAPPPMNGRRRPKRLRQRSLVSPTKGWTSSPERGPQSHMMLAHAWGIPSSCTYGVNRDSCRAHPNCIPHATDDTRKSLRSGTRGAAAACGGALPRRRRSVSVGITISAEGERVTRYLCEKAGKKNEKKKRNRWR